MIYDSILAELLAISDVMYFWLLMCSKSMTCCLVGCAWTTVSAPLPPLSSFGSSNEVGSHSHSEQPQCLHRQSAILNTRETFSNNNNKSSSMRSFTTHIHTPHSISYTRPISRLFSLLIAPSISNESHSKYVRKNQRKLLLIFLRILYFFTTLACHSEFN